jgi:hypothetical protein
VLRWRAGFGPEEGELIGIVLNLLLDADPGRVASAGAVVQKHGPPALRFELQQRRHLPCVKRVDPRVAVASEKHHGRIIRTLLHVLIRRLFVEIRKLLLLFGGTVLGGPVRALLELLIAEHIQKRIPAPDRGEKLRVLGDGDSHEQAAV